MNSRFSEISRVAAVVLALPVLGSSAAIQVNGICYGPGSCSNPGNPTDSITDGNPVNGGVNQVIAVGADIYSISATYSGAYDGSSEALTFSPVVTYIGSSPSSTADTIIIDEFQDVYDPTPGPFSASTQTEHFPLLIPFGASGSGQLFFNSTALPLIGPYGPGYYNISNSVAFGQVNSDYLAYEFQLIFTFDTGTPNGTQAGSAPEPYQAIPAALTLGGVALLTVGRARLKGVIS